MSQTAETLQAIASESVWLGPAEDRILTGRLVTLSERNPRAWMLMFAGTGLGTLMLFAAATYTILTGIGTWGNNIPVAWAMAITNFVWWIGIGHAGTFISAILYLLEQPWRASINRFAEGMTIFAIMQAGLFPVLHLGRPWFAYWLVPYPATMEVWPQFRSPLTWDAAAVSTYFTVSLLFWYVGLLPDFASARDITPDGWRRRAYAVLALGWSGSARGWRHYEKLYMLLAGLATPLVVSVHSIVSLDFSVAKLPGWHSTIFPPYFVAGAIFSGFAMVLTLLIPVRRIFRLKDIITAAHLDSMAKMLMLTGSIVAFAYLVETIIAWYSGNPFERHVLLFTRPFGQYAWLYWTLLFCNIVVPQLFWIRRLRVSPVALFIASLLVNVGMWAERFIIIVTSLSQDFLRSSWHTYTPTLVDGAIFFGSLSFFLFLFVLFLRLVPFIPIAELKKLRRDLDSEPEATS